MSIARTALGLSLACTWISAAAAALPGAELHPDVLRRLAETDAPVKVWAFLADKGHPDAAAEQRALAELEAGWPARSLARRAARRTRAGLVDQHDLPVAAPYVAALSAIAEPVVQSRWLNAVSLEVGAEQLASLAQLPFVERVTLVSRSSGTPARAEPATAFAGSSFYGFAEFQADLIDVPELHALGLTGAGTTIAVLDSGFVTTHDAFHQPGHELDIVAAYDFVDDDVVVGIEAGDPADQHHHGTLILGTMAAYLPDTLVGVAYDASYILCKTEDVSQEVQAEEDFYVAGLEFAELNGADVATSSLGYIDWYTQADLDGATAVTTVAVNVATANGLVCCTAAGNSGNDGDPLTSSLLAPADAFDVLSVGAAEFTGEQSSYSSSGPTADGRAKPEVLAMGTGVASVWYDDDTSIAQATGTSLSTPQVAGVVACLLGGNADASVASVRERLMDTADYFGEPKPDPLGVYGWGIVDADAAALIAGSWSDLGGGVAGTAGLPALVGSGALVGDEPVTLALTDGPAFGGGFLVIGLTALGAPFKGGTLVPDPDVVVGPVPLDGDGDVTLAFPWVPGLPSGVTTFYQVWTPDAGALVGFAGSNGVRGSTP